MALFLCQLLLSLVIAVLLSELLREQQSGGIPSLPCSHRAALLSLRCKCSGQAARVTITALLSLALYVVVSHDHEPSARSEEWRAVITAASFACLAYTEASLKMRRCMPPERFLYAAARVAPHWLCCVFPTALVVLAFAFLVLGSLIERAGGDHRILDRPIYAFVLYGPFASIYIVLKRELECQEQSLPI